MSTIESINTFKQLGSVRLCASTNQSGTYYNGPTNNGVGATFTYASGALTIDSVTVNVNDYILFSGQSSAYQNGIYQCIVAGATGVAAVLQRRGDFQCIEQIKGGQYVPVSAGTTLGGSIWTVVEPLPAAIGNPVTSGANNIVFNNAASEGTGLYLQIANNLSDVASASTAVTNLGFTHPAANTLASTGALVNGHLLQASGTAGLVSDTGYSTPAADASANADASVIAAPMSSNGAKGLSFSNVLPRYASGSLTLAQFNLLYTTPIELIPAPGAGFMSVVLQFGVEWVYGSAAPTSGGALYLEYGNTAHGTNYATPVAGIPAAFFTGLSASSAISCLGQINSTSGLATSVCGNAAVNLTNATAVFATGTGGSLNWYVWYMIVPIT